VPPAATASVGLGFNFLLEQLKFALIRFDPERGFCFGFGLFALAAPEQGFRE
jgi:hypothetical protein